MCLTYCTGRAVGQRREQAGHDLAGSVGCEAITSSRAGWSEPVRARYAA